MQTDAFRDGEGSAWWQRNKAVLLDPATVERDWPLRLIKRAGIKPERVASIGCANGWRLWALVERYGSECWGLDASQEAISDGLERYCANSINIGLRVGLAHDLPWQTAYFDVVIIYFVLHWLDRSALLRAIAEADRILKPGGYLIIGDFATQRDDWYLKREYHHRPGLWTYKHPWAYASIFEQTGCYVRIDTIRFDHETGRETDLADYRQQACCHLLRRVDCYQCE